MSEQTTPVDERAVLRSTIFAVLLANMKPGFEASVEKHGTLTIKCASNGALAMFEFGLVLAEKYPELAAELREANREYDEVTGIPISTEQAVDALVSAHSLLLP